MADADQQKDDEQLEREHFVRIINAFRHYRSFCQKKIQNAQKYYEELPEHHKRLIPNHPRHLRAVQSAVEHNYEIIKMIIDNADHMFENKTHDTLQNGSNNVKQTLPSMMDMDKVKTTIKQFVRDWSETGAVERAACYNPVIQEILERYPLQQCDPSSVNILVPGAGLGRLAFELAKLGYSCQGNEWSLFMLFASNFVLNRCKEVNSFILYPWVHQWTNVKCSADQIQPVLFPDVSPADLAPDANFSMAAGDFLEVYTDPGSWDCVATVFFIDTAHNIIAYIETIWKILKPGGIWINLGPLLYHFTDLANEVSIDLPYEDVRNAIVKMGFQLEKEDTTVKTSYIQNPKSMLQYAYDSVFFVAKKPS